MRHQWRVYRGALERDPSACKIDPDRQLVGIRTSVQSWTWHLTLAVIDSPLRTTGRIRIPSGQHLFNGFAALQANPINNPHPPVVALLVFSRAVQFQVLDSDPAMARLVTLFTAPISILDDTAAFGSKVRILVTLGFAIGLVAKKYLAAVPVDPDD